MNKETLYGKDKKGGYKIWSIWTEGDKLFIEHGKEGGKLQIKEEVIKGKNIGRANETTPAIQAINEAYSRVQKQLDKGYRFDKDALERLPIAAMLAQDYHKTKHKLKYPCYGSFKLDGLRCLAIKTDKGIILQSRGNKEYDVPHLKEALDQALRDVGDVWDGEIYSHGLVLEDISSATKKANENTPKLEFWAFDIARSYRWAVAEDIPFISRLDALDGFSVRKFDRVVFCNYILIENEEQLKQFHKHAISLGYEGIMLRNAFGIYESGKRSNDLFKYKEFFDDEFEIIAITEDRNGNAVFEVQNKFADNTFTVTYGDFEQRKLFLANADAYIGKYLKVKYQKLYKDTLIPQFPVGLGFRLLEDM